MPRKSILLFLLTLTALFILMTYQGRKGFIRIHNPLGGLLHLSSSAIDSFSRAVTAPFERISLREQDVQDLKKQVDELLLERSRTQEALQENKRLRELLGLRDRSANAVTSARIISRGADQWQNSFVLDQGSSAGVANNMAAITPQGLAGKIFSVTDSFSHLLLITDMNFSAAVRLQESRKEGVVSGTSAERLVLKYIPYEDDVKAGDVLVTSGLDQLFPPGIPVGYIAKIEKKGTTHFQEIEVMPFADTKRIEEVIVVR